MFNKKRLLTLAGVASNDKNSNLLNENMDSECDDTDMQESNDDVEDDADDLTEDGNCDDNCDDKNDDDDTKQLDEIRVRNFIRNEIRSMLNNMDPTDRRNWILRGQRLSSNSQQGSISRGFVGPGFIR